LSFAILQCGCRDGLRARKLGAFYASRFDSKKDDISERGADDETEQESTTSRVVMIIEEVFEEFGQLEVLRIAAESTACRRRGWDGCKFDQAWGGASVVFAHRRSRRS